ncbi:hypothetical protein GCM10020254_82910 [Streptomyces goshikiensis]
MRRLKAAAKPTGRGVIRENVSISARPAEAEDRTVPGCCEGDRVVGTRPSAIAALVERTSRFTAIVALPNGTKASRPPRTPHLTRRLLRIPPRLRRTLWRMRRGRRRRP